MTQPDGPGAVGRLPPSGEAPAGDAEAGDVAVGDDAARQLFRYLGGEEWREYRAIIAVFAGTFFSEFAPDDVVDALRSDGRSDIDPGVVPDRLESLRRWGNLAASTSIGNPSSLDDYYKRRHRYLITSAGQEVHDVVEGVLARVDDIGDVQAGRLRDLQRALVRLGALVAGGLEGMSTNDVADAVRAVFDPHESFSTEITQFFASINQWQSRFDLEPHEIKFFAEVLVGYVSEQLVEIERMARPIAVALRELEPDLDAIVLHARSGLAARVDDAGLAGSVTVRGVAGSARADWDHLLRWFGATVDGHSRLDGLTRQALAAVRTLTGNLTRLSRVGSGTASRRSDFIRLAGFVDRAESVGDVHDLVSAAFGLFPSRHLGLLSGDADDVVATTTPWAEAPAAEVPVMLRKRGDLGQRGSVTPIRDRAREREMLMRHREQDRVAEERTAMELLDAVDDDGRLRDAEVSVRALRRMRLLIGASGARRRSGSTTREASDRDLVCTVTRLPSESPDPCRSVTIGCPDGVLTLHDVELHLRPAHRPTPAPTPAPDELGTSSHTPPSRDQVGRR